MKISNYTTTTLFITDPKKIAGMVCCLMYMMLATFMPVSAKESSASENKQEDIRISADRLVAKSSSSYAEFAGNVHAVNSEMDITSDNLKVFYSQQSAPGETGTDEKSIAANKSIEKIVATGNVRIKVNEKSAETSMAVYTKKTGRIVMTGAGSKVIDENGSITGEKITIQPENEEVTVEGGSKGRVKAIINSGASGRKKAD